MTDTAKTIGNEEINGTGMEEEMQQAQKTGVVDFSKDKKKEKSGNYTHTFKSPVEIDGEKYSSLTFYFDRLTGEDIEAIETELQDQNQYILAPEISSVFQAMIAARAAKIPADAIRRLPVRDYMAIKNKARNFLLDMG